MNETLTILKYLANNVQFEHNESNISWDGTYSLVSRNYQYIEEKSFKSNLYQYMVSAVLNLNKMPKLHQQ